MVIKGKWFRRWGSMLAIAAVLVGLVRLPLDAAPLQVRINRWLEVRQVVGQVTYRRPQRSQPARAGMRLQAVGDGLTTAARSRSVVAVDTGIGFLDVAERTSFRIEELRALPDGGHTTRLNVTQGQVRLRIRKFTHPSSNLEIRTPAGWTAVRGTEFGVTVQPDGKMGVATRKGAVETRAQGQIVPVKAGFQNLTIPGEPPLPPVPLTDNTTLVPEVIAEVGDRQARISGRIDPVNLLLIGEQAQRIDRQGQFDLTLPLPMDRRIRAVVITPLGTQREYAFYIPPL